MRHSSNYRTDIDGLRAIAVLSVLAYHYRAPFPNFPLSGGFTGVDVFFVISGFLITQGLVHDVETGYFSVLNFYDRRVRRILPALIVMLASVLLAGRFLLMPGDYQSLATSSAAAAFGVSNFFFLGHTGYFDQTADLLPLLHTWSLGVEEQFYLVWPVLLYALCIRRTRLDVGAMIAGLAIAGFGASLIFFDADPKSAFYAVLPRAWELLLGALLVFLPKLPGRWANVATVSGAGLIFVGYLKIDESHFPNVAALLPCMGAALVIWPRTVETAAARLLGKLAPIGRISYSLYLWHWPIWVFYRIYVNGRQPTVPEALALAALSFALSTASFLFIEQPFRRKKLRPVQTVVAGLAASTLIFCASMFIDSADGLPNRIPANVLAMRSRDVMWEWPCPTERIFAQRDAVCVLGHSWHDTSKHFVLWGDSHASHYAPLFDATAKRLGWSGALLTWCPAVLDDKLSAYKNDEPAYASHCIDQRRSALAAIADDPSVHIVFIASAWTNLVVLRLNAGPALPDRFRAFEDALDRLLSDLTPLSRKIVIMGETPQWRSDPLPCNVADHTSLLRQSCGPDQNSIHLISKYQDAVLDLLAKGAAKHPDVLLFNPRRLMCDEFRCADVVDGEFLYRDSTHLRRNLSSRTRDDLSQLLQLDSLFNLR